MPAALRPGAPQASPRGVVANRPPRSPDRTLAARRWVRRHRARLERWPVWRLDRGERHEIGCELELLASDPSHPERPPPDARVLYHGLRELAGAARAKLPEPAGVRVHVRPYHGSLVVKTGADLSFEVPLCLVVVAASGSASSESRRHAAALEAHFAAVGMKRGC